MHGQLTRFMVAVVTAAAAVAVVVVPAVSGSGSAPAYAVTEQDDGSLILVIRDTDGMADLQGKLDELGVRARVLEGDDRCATGAPPEAPGAHFRYPMTFSIEEGPGTVHFDPALIHEDETLLIVVGRARGQREAAVGGQRSVPAAVPAGAGSRHTSMTSTSLRSLCCARLASDRGTRTTAAAESRDEVVYARSSTWWLLRMAARRASVP
ncbi:hypothetical protein ACIP29_37430 [Streptomyces coelicoflavus]|uniref:hypothetical protein n=1 Tax=Streptomyces coelicoflavus TaxID=285562 RepID=UPI0037F44FA2